MKPKLKSVLKIAAFGILAFLGALLVFFSAGSAPRAGEIQRGINFSQKQARLLDLEWKEAYLSLFEDLGAKNMKLITHWDLLEPEKGKYDFEDLDWQIREARKRDAEIILVAGMKTGRWPECHIPEWAEELGKEEMEKRILNLIERIVLRYMENETVKSWQIENEPFFPFGECPKITKDFLKKEIELVRILDKKKRDIIISDSGEFSLWMKAAGLGDVISCTLHRKVWFKEIKAYVSYPLNPVYYWRKAQLIKKFFGKKVICGELQAEPWCPVLLYDCLPGEQSKTMEPEQFKKNIEYAKKTGLDTFYFWGAEWWFWMKEKKDDPRIWDEAKKLFFSLEQ
jgi:hypothetical protein